MLRAPGDVAAQWVDVSDYIVMLNVTFLWILNVVILFFV